MGIEKNILVGVTAAYDIYPNEFREAILANELKNKLNRDGIKANLILINDDLDPFSEVHLKRLSKQNFVQEDYSRYLNFPICKIPSPNKKGNLANFFLKRYITKMQEMGVTFSKVICSSKMRNTPNFKKIAKQIISKKEEIISLIRNNFQKDFSERFFKIYSEKNGYEYSTDISDKNSIFKFPWFIECLIRWEVYNIDYEFFLEMYLNKETGSYNLSKCVCTEITKSKYVNPIRYEYLKFKKEILLFRKILPTQLFYDFIKEKNRTSDSFNLLELEKILKTNFYSKEMNKTYFEIYDFLSNFTIEEIRSKSFFKKFKKEFIKKEITKNQLNNFFERAIEYKRYLSVERKDYEIIGEINKCLKLISLNQKSKHISNLLEFKEFVKRYLNDFNQEDFITFNKLFYKSNKGMPLSTYLYFKHEKNLLEELLKVQTI